MGEMFENEKLNLFHTELSASTYNFFGCHKAVDNEGYVFRVWAPHASCAFICGTFSSCSKSIKMSRLSDGECFEAYIPYARQGDLYKFCFITEFGKEIYKADPYAFKSDFPNSTYSVIYDEVVGEKYERCGQHLNTPINIYEVNLLSWRKHKDNSYYTYKDLERELVPYVKKMGYTHVEFMPITEYPFDGSWGYQVTGYFSVVNRLGTPNDFKNLVKAFHDNGIKVLLDWVPAHFPKDDFALYEFDGQPLYESSDPQKTENKSWGTRAFDFEKTEVKSFLISSAAYFFEKFAIDGLRIDAVSSMLYLDYDKEPGEWTPNVYGDNRNLAAIEFIKQFNSILKKQFKDVLLIAEESSAFDGVTRSIKENGLGFDYKWNMGWMNDVLFYCRQDPIYRRYHHNKMTFSLVYAFSENYILPLSHDEVVHVKGSIINKMSGDFESKFAGERILLCYMYAHPGKKLNFMGYELGQFSEWNYATQLDWYLKDYKKHLQMQNFVKTLNLLYLSLPEFYEIDNGWSGFEWLVVNDEQSNVFAFNRYDKNKNCITAIFNFSGIDLNGYRIGIEEGKYRVIFNSDKRAFGGEGKVTKRIYNSENILSHGKENSIVVDIPKLTCIYLKKQ